MVEALLHQAPWLTPTYLFLLLNLVIATILISSAFSNRLKRPPPTPALQPVLRSPSLFSRVTSFNLASYQHQSQQYQSNQDNNTSTSFLSRVASFNFSGQTRESGQVESTTLEQDSRQDGPVEAKAGKVNTHLNRDSSSTSFFSRVASLNFPGRAGNVEPATQEKDSHDPNERKSIKGHVTRKEARKPYFLSRIKSFTPQKQDTQIQTEACEVDTHPEQVQKTNKSTGKKQKEVEVAKAETEETSKSKKRNEEDKIEDAKADDFINRFKQQLKLQRFDSFMRYKTA